MERLRLIQLIYSRLASLEKDREIARISGKSTVDIDADIDALRLKLQDVTNSLCPLVKDKGYFTKK